MKVIAVVVLLCLFSCAVAFSFRSKHKHFSLLKNPALPHRSTSQSSIEKYRLQHLLAATVPVDQTNVSQSLGNSLGWATALSMNPDLGAAVEEAVEVASTAASAAEQSPTVAMFYVSSIYEASAYDYDVIFKTIRRVVPSVQHIIGSTTGCAIGNVEIGGDPMEVEARASISIVLADLKDSDLSSSVKFISSSDISKYITEGDSTKLFDSKSEDTRSALMLSTELSKKNLTQFLSKLEEREGVQGFGAVASVVTSLHVPRVFISTADAPEQWEKHTAGVVALVLDEDVEVKTVVARSCLPVGPMYAITKRDGPDVLEMQRFSVQNNGERSSPLSPLEQLDALLKELPSAQSFALKKELLVGTVSGRPEDIEGTSIMSAAEFYGQKPPAFDPLTGSITVSGLKFLDTAADATFQFCIRDSTTSRRDLQDACQTLQKSLIDASPPLAVLMLGSMERGNRVFRHQHWESSQLGNVLRNLQYQGQVPIVGMYSAGSFTSQKIRIDSTAITVEAPALMEADSVYAIISRKSKGEDGTTINSVATPATDASLDGTSKASDVMTDAEREIYSDESDSVMVTKRDPESAQPVRVGTMDYFIPEKMPQPSNFLESLVWEREKDVDRMREQFQLTRALSQAKLASLKYPQRNLYEYITQVKKNNELLSTGGAPTPLMMIEILRQSVNNGNSPQADIDFHAWQAFLSQTAADLEGLNPVVAIGGQADTSTFKGQYDDLTALKTATKVPVFCNDFVVYVFQLLRAKICGSDVVKLMAAVLPVQDINYLLKIGKAVGITCVVVVNSKVQLLDVLSNGPGVEAISLTSRNFRLWKIDEGKANRILSDGDVASAIKAKNTQMLEEFNKVQAAAEEQASEEEARVKLPPPRLLVFQEGFSNPQELSEIDHEMVDAVFVGEELLPLDGHMTLREKVQLWFS